MTESSRPGRFPLRELKFNGKVVGYFEGTGDLDGDAQRALEVLAEKGINPFDDRRPQWKKVRYQALEFHAASTAIHGATILHGDTRRPLIAAYVANTCFCLELYLKAASLLFGGETLWGHHLRALYDKLPEAARGAIQGSVAEAREAAPGPDDVDVSALLDRLNNAFVEWRYAQDVPVLQAVDLSELRFLRILFFLACQHESDDDYEIDEIDPAA
ncbi:hypothetical protein V3391_06690 [Luteimonas sp. SMYT11W]|uniref:HEPN domain-containing protein n=1 Tax=Luteimonas flava TaxID=3115822 RepID=A0ABU7WD38_9GAMM